MDLWNKMISSLADVFSQKDLDDEALLSQANAALKAERLLWLKQDSFVDPSAIEQFQNEWRSAYFTAKKKAKRVGLFSGLFGSELRNAITHFIKAYEALPQKLQKHNEQVASEKATAAAKLILPVEGKLLDSQQMRCITKEVRNHLILAGAGTGKTTTIVGFVKYLLKSGACDAKDILVLSFTNASASEMSQRLNAELEMPIAASTFHKLGLDIITTVQSKKPNIYSDDLRRFVRRQLDELTQNITYLNKLCDYLVYSKANQKSEFDFRTEKEYRAYLKYNPPVTLKNETVKSYGELDITNYLFQNGIAYVYEQDYPVDTRTSEYGQYRPDFFLPDYNIYIEYFGINRQGEVPAYYKGKDTMTATQVYQEGIEWKRKLHRQYGTLLIELYAYEKFEETLLPHLGELLNDAGVTFAPIAPKDMWAAIGGSDSQKLDRIAELFATVITLTKSNNCNLDDIRKRNRRTQNLPSIDVVLDLIEPIFDNYQNELHQSGKIDFNDMINLAAEYVQSGQYVHPFQYVVVDEYQDISQSRYRLLDAMRQQNDYRLFCVGDDWQSIYRFAGSDIGFILNFEKYWGASEISRIETTYRFPQSLISISGSFIMKNPEQKVKHLQSALIDKGFSMEQITGYTDHYCVVFLAERLKDLPINSSVLFLGRYRFDIKILDGHNLFSYRYNAATGQTDVTFVQRPDLKVSFMTVHSSKGLQADYVFLLNNKAYGMGFPSQIADAPVLHLLLDNCDHYPFAEERRLFYVAITRAKKKVWLVTQKGNESVFVKELDDAYGDAMRREQYTCPLCGGRLMRRSGPYGDFYGCSNYNATGCRYKRNIAKRENSAKP